MQSFKIHFVVVWCSVLSNILFADLVDSFEPEKKDAKVEIKKNTTEKSSSPKKEEPSREELKKDKEEKVSKKHKKSEDDQTKRPPVKFQSKDFKARKAEGVIELEKDVVVTQGDFTLNSDRAVIHMDQETEEVKEIFAYGNVRITKKDPETGKIVTAVSLSAKFDNGTQVVSLHEKARVEKGGDEIAGEHIFYNLLTGLIEVKKVKGIVSP